MLPTGTQEPARRVDLHAVVFMLNTAGVRCQIILPVAPQSLEITRSGATLGLICTYREQELQHLVTFLPAGAWQDQISRYHCTVRAFYGTWVAGV